MILEKKGTTITDYGEDWNGLKMTILKVLASVFKIYFFIYMFYNFLQGATLAKFKTFSRGDAEPLEIM